MEIKSLRKLTHKFLISGSLPAKHSLLCVKTMRQSHNKIVGHRKTPSQHFFPLIIPGIFPGSHSEISTTRWKLWPIGKGELDRRWKKKKKMPASTILTLRPHFPPQIILCSSENSPNPLLLTLADTRARKSRKEGEKSQTDQQKGKEQVKTSSAGLGNQAEKQVKIPLENKFSFYYLSFWGGIKI